MTLFITSIYMLILVYFCLPGVDIEEYQSDSRLRYSHPLHKILEYFLTYALIILLIVIFALAHETICILYPMIGSTHHTPTQHSIYYWLALLN